MAGMKETSELETFVSQHAPISLQCPDLMAGSVARILFDLGRLYERQQFELGESGKIWTKKIGDL